MKYFIFTNESKGRAGGWKWNLSSQQIMIPASLNTLVFELAVIRLSVQEALEQEYPSNPYW